MSKDTDVMLTTVYSSMEAELIMSLLRSENIPSYKKVKGFGGYAQILFGEGIHCMIEIYVPQDSFKRACELLESKDFQDFPDEEE
ncbi:MAG: DUF2007 domain-containing protein [Bacillota bacterium]|nr:DUF2007 domain-containing protein [Bacillota bacterium]